MHDSLKFPALYAFNRRGNGGCGITQHAIERALERIFGLKRGRAVVIVRDPHAASESDRNRYSMAIEHIQTAYRDGRVLSTDEAYKVLRAQTRKQRERKRSATWVSYNHTNLCVIDKSIVTLIHATPLRIAEIQSLRKPTRTPVDRSSEVYHQSLGRVYCKYLLGLNFRRTVPQHHVDEAVAVFDYAIRRGQVATDEQIASHSLEEGVLMTTFGVYPLLERDGSIQKFYFYKPDFNKYIGVIRKVLKLD